MRARAWGRAGNFPQNSARPPECFFLRSSFESPASSGGCRIRYGLIKIPGFLVPDLFTFLQSPLELSIFFLVVIGVNRTRRVENSLDTARLIRLAGVTTAFDRRATPKSH